MDDAKIYNIPGGCPIQINDVNTRSAQRLPAQGHRQRIIVKNGLLGIIALI
jgi:hypothetical protein